mmetsp:Transcript_29855/g.53704  ORF Transcript_29855/g.53704 Transcript_29855/m.53704 type:complete len:214 (-) Transcript_29855:1081-1722(-)
MSSCLICSILSSAFRRSFFFFFASFILSSVSFSLSALHVSTSFCNLSPSAKASSHCCFMSSFFLRQASIVSLVSFFTRSCNSWASRAFLSASSLTTCAWYSAMQSFRYWGLVCTSALRVRGRWILYSVASCAMRTSAAICSQTFNCSKNSCSATLSPTFTAAAFRPFTRSANRRELSDSLKLPPVGDRLVIKRMRAPGSTKELRSSLVSLESR